MSPRPGRIRDLARICRTTTVAEARAHLYLTGDTSAIVFSHGRPVGVVMEATLTGAVNAGEADAPVGSVMAQGGRAARRGRGRPVSRPDAVK